MEEDVVATATSYTFQGLLSGTGYTVSIVALSGELPSEVVGPIAPSSKTPSLSLTGLHWVFSLRSYSSLCHSLLHLFPSSCGGGPHTHMCGGCP